MKRLFYIGLLWLLAFNTPAGILVQFRTTANYIDPTTSGNIDVELFEDKPVTVQNFLRYVKSGAYQNMFLHRCIPGFIVQGGGYGVINPFSSNRFSNNDNNVFSVQSLGAITNEFNVGRRLTNSFGTIAMAKTNGNPDSASSEWFFNLADNGPNLDFQNGGFTVFGRTVRGTNVLNIFNNMDKSTACRIEDMRWWLGTTPFTQLFTDLPVTYCFLDQPFYGDLIYVYDISLVNVQVQTLSNSTHQISWNTLAGQTNYTVQFTTNLPPGNSWQTLASTNGTNATLKLIDPVINSPRRFYRVRADY